MISLQNVEKNYRGKYIGLHETSIEFDKGSLTCLIGPNGAGKSTLIKLITRLTRPSSGSVVYNKNDVRIGYMPEIMNLPPGITGARLINIIGDLSDNSRLLNKFTELMQMHDYLDKSIEELSKGMQKKIGLAAALAVNPSLLILDEPLDGLDILDRGKLLGFISEELNNGLTVILSTHILHDLDGIAAQTLFIRRGELIVRIKHNKVEFTSDMTGVIKDQINTLVQNEASTNSTLSEIYKVLYT